MIVLALPIMVVVALLGTRRVGRRAMPAGPPRHRHEHGRPMPLRRYLPILTWGAAATRARPLSERPDRGGDRHHHADPAVAGLCAAGGPAAAGRPLRLDGAAPGSTRSSAPRRTLAVGPVAVASLMTAAAAGRGRGAGHAGVPGRRPSRSPWSSGLLLAGHGRCSGSASWRNFLSHPVISGFITASAFQIAAGQLGAVLGVHAGGDALLEIAARSSASARPNPATAVIGVRPSPSCSGSRSGLKPLLLGLGLGEAGRHALEGWRRRGRGRDDRRGRGLRPGARARRRAPSATVPSGLPA